MKKNMLNDVFKHLLLLQLFLLFTTHSIAYSAPNIVKATLNGNELSVSGSNFGFKSTENPIYFSSFDSEQNGSIPKNHITNIKNYGTVESNIYRGSKSLEFNYLATAGINQGDWKRNVIDFGNSGTKSIYFSFWLYLDKGNSTSMSWQWKNYVSTACSNMYACTDSTSPFVIFEPWYFNNTSWGNSGSPHVYKGGLKLSKTYGTPKDAYLWNQWQRIELYLQRSSSDEKADGVVYISRIGRSSPMVSGNDVVTHKIGDGDWRYLSLSQAIESVYDGYVNLKVYMDDVYVDNSRARIEICDTSEWALRTHCEIQPTTSWADDYVTTIFNSGGFKEGQIAYIYVSDQNGIVNENGTKFIIGSLKMSPEILNIVNRQ